MSCRKEFESSKAFEDYLHELKEGKHVKKMSKVEVLPIAAVQKQAVSLPYQSVTKANAFRKLIKDKLDFRDNKIKFKKQIEDPMVIHRRSLVDTPLIRRSSSVSSVMRIRRISDGDKNI